MNNLGSAIRIADEDHGRADEAEHEHPSRLTKDIYDEKLHGSKEGDFNGFSFTNYSVLGEVNTPDDSKRK